MPKKLRADKWNAATVRRYLEAREGLGHLRVRHRGDLLTLESGPEGDAAKHARLRRVTVQYWQLEMATHTGRWEPTPFRGTLDEVLDLLVETFGWVLTPVHYPEGTSDPEY